MTKDEELQVLDQAIATLGTTSYIGPWLAEHRDSIAQDLRSDLTPSYPSPSQARAEYARIVHQAEREAIEIKQRGASQAYQAEVDAAEHIRRAKQRARDELVTIANSL